MSTILYEAKCETCKIQISLGIHDLDDKGCAWGAFQCPSCCAEITPESVKDLEDWKTEACEFLKKGRVDAAVRHCREQTGMGIREAKSAVEALPQFWAIQEERAKIVPPAVAAPIPATTAGPSSALKNMTAPPIIYRDAIIDLELGA